MNERKYTNPEAAGCLLEAEACGKVAKELHRITEKYKRKIDKTQAARAAEFEAAMGYGSEDEIREAYGWGYINESQYRFYLDVFHNGQAALEHGTPTSTDRAHKILSRILSELAAEQAEWAFAALSPAEQAAEMERAEKAKKEWQENIRKMKEQLRAVPQHDEEETL